MFATTRRPSGTRLTPRLTMVSTAVRLISFPSSRISPDDAGTSPQIADSVVVLPAPLAPIRQTQAPVGTDSEMPSSTSTAPYPAFRLRTSSIIAPQIGFDDRRASANFGGRPL